MELKLYDLQCLTLSSKSQVPGLTSRAWCCSDYLFVLTSVAGSPDCGDFAPCSTDCVATASTASAPVDGWGRLAQRRVRRNSGIEYRNIPNLMIF